MATGSTYLSLSTLNVSRFNSPTKRHRVVEWIRNKVQLYITYKKFILSLKEYIGWKWRDEKLCQWKW